MSDEYIEHEIDFEMVDRIAKKVESAVNSILDSEPEGQIELWTVLLSLSSQLAIDLGVDKDDFLSMISTAYYNAEAENEGDDGDDQYNWN